MSDRLPRKIKPYQQHFRMEWLKHADLKDWLTCVTGPPNNIKRAKCKYCQSVLSNKLSDLKMHATRAKHSEAAGILSLQNVIPFKKTTEINLTKCAEAFLSLYIAEHSSILSVDHLGMLVKKVFKDSKAAENFCLHRTKCAAIITNILEPHFKSQLLSDIEGSPYSLIIDESTDISVNKYLGLVIIYYSKIKNKTVSTFLDLAFLESATAQAIVDTIFKTLDKFQLKPEKMVCIGTDNASVMVGRNSGVYTKLKEKCPHIILIRCVCHSLQLATSFATKEHLPRALEFLVAESYNWFARSSSRQIQYKTVYNLINDDTDPLKLLQCSTTRWLSIERAVKRILDQWLELKTHFEIMAQKERCYLSEQLCLMYKDKKNVAFLKFLHPILEEVQRVVKIFESSNADHSKILSDLLLLISFLLKKVVIPTAKIDPLSADFENHLDPKPYMGYSFEKIMDELRIEHFSHEEEMDLRVRCTQFVTTLIKELQRRLPENINTLKKINLTSVHNILSHQKEPITELLEEFKYSSDSITKIE